MASSELKKSEQMFCEAYDSWHDHAKIASSDVSDTSTLRIKCDLQSYSSILFAGMGGSATAGEIVASILDGSKVRCSVLKGSVMPDSVDRNSLVVASSVSGNTYETIQIVKSCQKRGIDVITLSSGGELESISNNGGIPHLHIKNLGAPRISLPCLVYPILNIVKGIEPGLERQIQSSLKALYEISKVINSTVSSERNLARALAMFMRDKMPVCYYTASLKPAGIRFKNSLNENAKIQAIADDIEESCHNSIVPFSFEKEKSGVILLRSNKDDSMLVKRFDVLRKFLNETGVQTYEINGFGDTLLANIMSLIYILDYSTVYLASIKGHDPSVTPAIDFVKSIMKDNS